jgi:hypothetical protein
MRHSTVATTLAMIFDLRYNDQNLLEVTNLNQSRMMRNPTSPISGKIAPKSGGRFYDFFGRAKMGGMQTISPHTLDNFPW